MSKTRSCGQASLCWEELTLSTGPQCLLQDDSSTLKACGVTASKTVLVLGPVRGEQQILLAMQEQQAQQAHQRAERLERLRKAAKSLAERSGSRCCSRMIRFCTCTALWWELLWAI